jgi:hypothetical protein
MKKRKKFISPLTGKPYQYYADMILHDELEIKEMICKPRRLKLLKNAPNK